MKPFFFHGAMTIFASPYKYDDNKNIVVMLDDITEMDFDAEKKKSCLHLAQTFDMTMFVSMPFSDILQSKTQYERILNHPLVRRPVAGTVVYCDDHPEYGIFQEANLSADRLRDFCDPRVLRMIDYDTQHNTEYFLTLKLYVGACGNVKEASYNLNVHANTILYRVKRLKELFDIDLTEANTLFSAMLTLRILDYTE